MSSTRISDEPLSLPVPLPREAESEEKTEAEAYMLHRDEQESERLNRQHEFFVEFFGGQLLHPAIPLGGVKTVADVGTGTGVWLLQTAALLGEDGRDYRCIGFDISDRQFPRRRDDKDDEDDDGVEFVVHDMTKPFPVEYHDFFDVLHVRLVSYALKAVDVDKAVRNVVQILKPGGWLHWEEGDVIDSWVVPESEAMRKRCSYIVGERVARGLTPALVTPLIQTLTGLRSVETDSSLLPDEVNQNSDSSQATFNILTWNDQDLLRVFSIDTVSSFHHGSELINRLKHEVFGAAGKVFMRIGAARRRDLAAQPGTDLTEAAKLRDEAEEMELLATHPDLDNGETNAEITRILARKAVFGSNYSEWTALRYPSASGPSSSR